MHNINLLTFSYDLEDTLLKKMCLFIFWCAWAPLGFGVCGLLTTVDSLVVEHGLQVTRAEEVVARRF